MMNEEELISDHTFSSNKVSPSAMVAGDETCNLGKISNMIKRLYMFYRTVYIEVGRPLIVWKCTGLKHIYRVCQSRWIGHELA